MVHSQVQWEFSLLANTSKRWSLKLCIYVAILNTVDVIFVAKSAIIEAIHMIVTVY